MVKDSNGVMECPLVHKSFRGICQTGIVLLRRYAYGTTIFLGGDNNKVEHGQNFTVFFSNASRV